MLPYLSQRTSEMPSILCHLIIFFSVADILSFYVFLVLFLMVALDTSLLFSSLLVYLVYLE